METKPWFAPRFGSGRLRRGQPRAG